MNPETPRILYCHCQYAQVVPKEVKDAVLRKMSMIKSASHTKAWLEIG